MQCINHHERSAIGSCKYCHKGLCVECAQDTGHGLACSDHVEAVDAMHQLHENAARTYASSPRSVFLSNFFLLVMGLGLMIFGLVIGKRIAWPLVIMGAGFSIYWLVLTLYNRRLFRRIHTDLDKTV